jgi:hypothetical protein
MKLNDELEPRRTWLAKELGLRFDPFTHLDAGADPQLSTYLVDHEAFPLLWGNWPSFLFAPNGGGKTAFRVRLARACRVRLDNRRILPVIFRPPSPQDSPQSLEENSYFEALLNAVATALLLELAYRPDRFLRLNTTSQKEVRFFLERNLSGPLDYYLEQLEDAGALEPLTRTFDPTAKGLPSKPLPESIRSFCEKMYQTQIEGNLSSDPLTQIEQAIDLLKRSLGYEAVYVLTDGVDAYVQDPSIAMQLLEPLLTRTRTWEKSGFFIKYFLTEELLPSIRELHQPLLTSPSKVTIIEWNVDSLAEVVRERLRVASEGMFDSLTAISRPDVSGQIERHLAEAISPSIPREIIRLSQRVFTEHVDRVGPYGRLEQRDFEAALAWYPDP